MLHVASIMNTTCVDRQNKNKVTNVRGITKNLKSFKTRVNKTHILQETTITTTTVAAGVRNSKNTSVNFNNT